MFRYALIAIGLCLLCRWAFGKWPWSYLSPAPTRRQAVFKARKLLAVPVDADRADIIEAHKRRVVMVHPDRGGSETAVHEANAARDLLLDDLPHAH